MTLWWLDKQFLLSQDIPCADELKAEKGEDMDKTDLSFVMLMLELEEAPQGLDVRHCRQAGEGSW